MKKLLPALTLVFGLCLPITAVIAVAPSTASAQEEGAAPEAAAMAEAPVAPEAVAPAAEAPTAEAPAAEAPAAQASTIDRAAEFYQSGGWVMHFIALVMAIAIAITIERAYYLFVKAKVNKHQFLSQIIADINAGKLDNAIAFAGKNQSPLAKITKAGIERAKANDPDFIDAMDQASLANIPFLERNTPYLATIGNVATLLGLLGTVLGLIGAFGAAAYADPSQKAAMLSQSISEAMNTTAFGMIVAIPALVAFSLLNGKTQRILEDIQEASSVVIDKLNKRSQKA